MLCLWFFCVGPYLHGTCSATPVLAVFYSGAAVHTKSAQMLQGVRSQGFSGYVCTCGRVCVCVGAQGTHNNTDAHTSIKMHGGHSAAAAAAARGRTSHTTSAAPVRPPSMGVPRGPMSANIAGSITSELTIAAAMSTR